MGLLRDALFSAAMLLVGAVGTSALPSGEVVREPQVAPAAAASLEPPHRDGTDDAPEWSPALQSAPAAPVSPVEAVQLPPPPAPQPRDGVPAVQLGAVPPHNIEAALTRSAWPPYLWPTVIAIARCESGLNPAAVGDYGVSWGLMQIHSLAHPALVARYDVFSPDGALAAAWEIYVAAGSFRPWSCARSYS